MNRISLSTKYGSLLLAQTGVVMFMFWITFPLFREVVMHPGKILDLSLFTEIVIIGEAALLLSLYWMRFYRVAIYIPFQNAVIGHLIQFASRVSFFFGGAVFAAIFFRHIPELDKLPPFGSAAIRALGVFLSLFSLYCYSLELDRLGRRLEEQEQGNSLSGVLRIRNPNS